MTKIQAKKRIEKLKAEIDHHRYLYHVLDKQEISDSALDSLKRELFDLEQKYPDLITPDSPTQRVSGKPLDKFKKHKHKQPMLSLSDAFNKQEILDWENRILKLINKKINFYCEAKIDGLAVALIYKKGILIKGATRGDGRIGEDVTQNLKTIESIPLKLEKSINCEVRGEVYITKKGFAKFAKQYSNPRNLAAGSVRQLDPKISAGRNLHFLAWSLIMPNIKNQKLEAELLKKLGFKTAHGKFCKNLQEVMDYYNKIQKKRAKLPYLIDGLVVSVNNNKLFKELGAIGKAPRGAIALKFPGAETSTIIKDIKIQIGRTGALTPVAHLKPVSLQGTTISRATLHNQDEIDRLDIRIGDTVIIKRAGDVIPDIVKVLKRLRPKNSKKFKMPKICPVCKSKIIKKPGEIAHYCYSKKCSAMHRRNLYHFVSKKAFNIEGMGPKVIDQLLNNNLISNSADIFELKQGDLIPLERFAQKSAENLIQAINNAKKISLARFIYALGIRHIGEETAGLLAQAISNAKFPISKLKNQSIQWLENTNDIGPIVGQSIYNWFNNKDNQELLKKLLKYVKIKNQELIIKNQELKNLNFVFTGELETMTRDYAQEKIKFLGGKISNSISEKTDYLILGKNPGSKYNKAKKLEIKILNEKEFIKKIS